MLANFRVTGLDFSTLTSRSPIIAIKKYLDLWSPIATTYYVGKQTDDKMSFICLRRVLQRW